MIEIYRLEGDVHRGLEEVVMQRLLGLTVVLGFGLAPPATKGEDAKRFVGTWRLVSIESATGGASSGSHPIGLIYYDDKGNMAVQIMPDRDRPKWKAGESPTPEQAKETLSGYTAYFGTYTVDETARTVTHHRQGSLTASGVGVDLVRNYELAPGDRLILTPVESPSTHLTWERAR
jgi:Lipocalin-like domain